MRSRAFRLAQFAALLPAAVVAQLQPAAARPLGARAQGVLQMPGEYPWGVHYEPGFPWEWARSEKSSQYRLIIGSDEHCVPYFPAPPGTAESFPFRAPESGPGSGPAVRHSVARNPVAAVRGYGAVNQAHLVEVEVNGGRGATGSSFVVASLRVIDGTSEVPWVLTDQLLRLRRRFDAAVRSHGRQLEAALTKAKRARAAQPGGTILRELETFELVIFEPTWDPSDRRLTVFFGHKRQGGFWIRSAPPARQGNVKHAPAPPERGVSYLAAMGARYVVDASGALREEEIFPPDPSYGGVPWKRPAPAFSAAPVSGKLRYYRTCGDHVCQDGGYRGPTAGTPLCTTQREGGPCGRRGETCDLHNDCNMFLVCAAADPATRCPR
jgi:hypothetical protein